MAKNIKLVVKFEKQKVMKAIKKANITNIFKAAGFIQKTMKNSIKRRNPKKIEKTVDGVDRLVNQSSAVGQPPLTKEGALKNAIIFEVSKQGDNAIIGPDGGKVSNVGKAHEFGGSFRGRDYQRRPFAAPALEKVRNKLPKLWAKSVKG